MINITNSRTFCPALWTDVRLGTNGSVGVCSFSRDVGNSNSDTVENILNNRIINEIKQSIKDEKWHPNCSYCQEAEMFGGRSERLHYIKNFDTDLKKAIDENPNERYLRNISLNLNNLCNLSCNYCNPQTSTEWMKILNIPVTLSKLENRNLEFLLKNTQNIKNVMIGGGEPLLQKGISDLLSYLRNPNGTSIIITTNLSIDLEKNSVFNAIVNNNKIFASWMISFDGIKDKFEYVRHGATWEQFEKNIHILKKFNQRIIAHPAFCLYSAFDLDEYYEYCVRMNLDIFWCDLFQPVELDIRHAPESIRNLSIEFIDKILVKYKDYDNLSLNTLLEYKKMAQIGSPTKLTNVDYSTNASRAKNILSFNSKIEQLMIKSKSFAELWPEVHSKLLKELND